MNKIKLIIAREYLTRVRKKSFWLVTLLMPVLISLIYAIPILIALSDQTEAQKVALYDESGLINPKDLSDDELTVSSIKSLNPSIPALLKSEYEILVVVPKNILDQPKALRIYAEKTLSIGVKSTLERKIQGICRAQLLINAGIDKKVYESTQVDVDGETIVVNDQGEEKTSSSGGTAILGGFLGFLLYLTVFIYGSMVMNGVIEEKSNRIVEVIVSSVRPYQLMLGKVIGIGLVGLTQFSLWIALTVGIGSVSSSFLESKKVVIEQQQKNMAQIADSDQAVAAQEAAPNEFMDEMNRLLDSVNIPLILGCFLFYFLLGYFMYASLFAAIGSAVENASEAQQFMMPITIPIVISFILGQFVIQNPNGDLAFWASIIPLTSPINMMVRLPYGVPVWELILSMGLLVLGFLGTTWISSRIYRVGILMYGKKITWKELRKWVFY